MNRIICSAVLFAVSALGLSAQTMKLQATVPFGFHVGGTSLPPGDYVVTHNGHTTLVSIQDARGRFVAKPVFSQGEILGNRAANALLVFNRYGNEYFLSKLQSPGLTEQRIVRKTKLENVVAKATESGLAVTASVNAKPK